jgi:hypothetical protein
MAADCWLTFAYVRWRLLRTKLYPWLILVSAGLRWLCSSGAERIHAQNRCWLAITKINVAQVSEFLNYLLW